MGEVKPFVEIIDQRIADFFRSVSVDVARISPDLAPLVEYSSLLLKGGKRFRARFCYWGWRAVANPTGTDSALIDPSAVTSLATALEVFHAAALVHDDIMDNSDTRRGDPAAHRWFEAKHRAEKFAGDASHYGVSTALLVGDLLLAWSDELLSDAVTSLPSREHQIATRREYARMRSEVTLGQYLDIHEEAAWRTIPVLEHFERSMRVVTYKSAKYSMEAPLRLGASLAGASTQQLDHLSAFGLPLGIAFQLRDDLLGVFGDPEVTGKPAGDDLREGKRTVLIALAESKMTPSAKSVFADMLGDPELSDEQIAVMRTTLHDTGAVNQTEQLIEQSVERALSALERATISEEARGELRRLADVVTKRHA